MIDKETLINEIDAYVNKSVFVVLIEQSNDEYYNISLNTIRKLIDNSAGLRKINRMINNCMKDAILFYCDENLIDFLNEGIKLKQKIRTFKKSIEQKGIYGRA